MSDDPKADLIRALTVEQYTSPWWRTPPTDPDPPDAVEARRRALDDAHKAARKKRT